MSRSGTKMVPVYDNHFGGLSATLQSHVPFSRTVPASGHVQEGTNATMLRPDVQPYVIVKAGALITVVITNSTCC